MISSIQRKATPEERAKLKRRSPGLYKTIEDFVMKLVFVFVILLAPLLIYEHFSPVSSYIQGISSIFILIVAVVITFWLHHKYNPNKVYNNQDLHNIEVVRVSCSRAVKREDPEDFGIAFYIDVTDKGSRKTLFLWGQYLDELVDGKFPSTEFEFLRFPGSDEFIDFRVTGTYFTEERRLRPFSESQLKRGEFPVNGQLLNQSIDTITM